MERAPKTKLDWLLNPPPQVEDGERIQRARLLSALLLVLIFLGSIIIALVLQADPDDIGEPTVKGVFAMLGISAAMYWLNRLGHTHLAAMGLILPLAGIFVYIPFYSGESPIFLAFILIPIILTAFFYTARYTILVSLALIVIIYILIGGMDPSADNLDYWNMRNMWYFLVVSAGLILTYIGHSSVLENLRRQDLHALNLRLQENEARLRAIFENSPDLIFEVGREGKITLVNRETDSYLGRYVRDLVLPEYANLVDKILQQASENGEAISLELQTFAPHGKTTWDSIRIGPIKRQGRITSFTAISTDITSRIEMEKTIRENEERYRNFIELSSDAIWHVDFEEPIPMDLMESELTERILHQGRVVDCNQPFARLYGYGRAEEIRGLTMDRIMRFHSDKQAISLFVRNGFELSESETQETDADGKSRHYVSSMISIVKDGRLARLWGTIREITARKQAELEREKLITELEKRNLELERFNYTLSHELKTPLVTMRGFLGYLRNDVAKGNLEGAQSDLSRIVTATDRMNNMINELLELTRIGYRGTPYEDIPFEDLIRGGLSPLEELIRECRVRIQIEPGLPAVHGDRTRLMEVIKNLTHNSIKYMGPQTSPSISFGVRHKPEGPQFFVRDNGMGIDPTYHEKIFGLFEKLDPQSEGSGIGLALVKRIIETHGGRIWVESGGAGQGSSFLFTLPAAKNQMHGKCVPQPPLGGG